MRNSIKDLLESMEIQKHTTETFHEIEKLQNPSDCSFAFISSSETEKGELRKHGNKYVVTLAANRNYNSFSESIFPAKIEVGNDAYYSDDALVTKTTISSNVFPAIEYEVSLSNLHKGNDSKFYRIVLPLNRELDLIGLFTVYKFCFNHYGSSIELVKTYIEGREFHIYKLSNNKSNYLLIDCLFLACQILVRLLYKMIFKIIGYEGNIVNILKHNDNLFESIKDEPMLIEI